MSNRPGFTLPDMLVTLVVVGVIGASLAQVMSVQAQFYQKQEGRSQARALARNATNIMMADLRMIETGGGVVAATSSSITLRVPYAMGIVCENDPGNGVVSLTPVDSVLYSEGHLGRSGYASRTSTGSYDYYEGSVGVGGGSASTCTANDIDVVPGAMVRTITPDLPSAATPGTPFFLYQNVTYSFSTSGSVSGRIGLWRTIVSRALAEEIAAPFDSSAVFRFYVDGSNSPQSAVPSPVTNIRGLELQLTAINERVAHRNPEERAPYTTSVFFKNRM
jgi:type II secretory pathway pseudopilin PulG